MRASKVLFVLGVKPLNNTSVCHSLSFILYCCPGMAFRVMVVAVAEARVGAAGAAWVAFVTVAVGAEVMLPSQLAAVTVTVRVSPMSATEIE